MANYQIRLNLKSEPLGIHHCLLLNMEELELKLVNGNMYRMAIVLFTVTCRELVSLASYVQLYVNCTVHYVV